MTSFSEVPPLSFFLKGSGMMLLIAITLLVIPEKRIFSPSSRNHFIGLVCTTPSDSSQLLAPYVVKQKSPKEENLTVFVRLQPESSMKYVLTSKISRMVG